MSDEADDKIRSATSTSSDAAEDSTEDNSKAPVTPTFADLELDPRIVAAVAKLGFEAPTPIQARAIKPLLAGRDLIGRARTGSGKTAAFGLPLLHLLAQGGKGVRALVLAPTRELALQITAALSDYSAGLALDMVTLYGGAGYHPQFAALHRGVDIVVGTPGRLVDHLERGSLDLSNVQLVVIDEADEMLRMGFVDDLTKILQAIPETRQVALFSATMPTPIRRVAETYLRDPVEVHVEQGQLVVEHIEQLRVDVPVGHEIDTLVRVLKAKEVGATLIFARTRVTCDDLAAALRQRGLPARPLHGDMSQAAREEVLGALRNHEIDLVVATDVAARGIDVEHLTHVINFDLPEEVEVYVNRIGRTGRAGRAGMAISLIKKRDMRLLYRIEGRLRKRIAERPVPSDAQIVGRQRDDLETALKAALEHKNSDNALALRDALLASESRSEDGSRSEGEGKSDGESSWTLEDLAAAALGLVMQDRHLDIDANPSEEPPRWARRPERRARTMRTEPTPARRSASSHERAAADQATIGANVGREQGIGPNDVVGALANELGVPRQAIGRITILGQHLTVSVTEEVVAMLAQNPKTVFLRGNPVVFARPGQRVADAAPTGRPQRPFRPGRGPRGERSSQGEQGGDRPPRRFPPKKKPRGSATPGGGRNAGVGGGGYQGRSDSTGSKRGKPRRPGKPGGKPGKPGAAKGGVGKVHKGRQGPARKGKGK